MFSFAALGAMLTPYKIAAMVVALLAIVGAGLYVKSIFAERSTLLTDKGRLETELTVEKLKYAALLKQSEQIMVMNKEIIEAVQRVKINSSVYIDRVEASPLPAPRAGGTVLVHGGTFNRLPQALPPAAGLPVVNYPFTERTAPLAP